MTCNEMRKTMRERFDNGYLDFEKDATTHIERCPACARHAARLMALSAGLGALPTPAPVPELAARISRRVALEAKAEYALRRVAARWAVAVAALAAVLGFIFPKAIQIRELWRQAENSYSNVQWRSFYEPWLANGRELFGQLEVLVERSTAFSSAYLWLAVGGGLLLLLMFNGLEARSLRRR